MVLLCLFLNSPAAGGDKKYLGAKTCGGCHRAQFEQQSQSGHANTLFPVEKPPLLK